MPRSPSVLLAVVIALFACDRRVTERANDTVAVEPAPPEAATPILTAEPAWDTASGPVFVVMGATADQGALVLPMADSAALLDTVPLPTRDWRALPIELFRDGRLVGATTLGEPVARDPADECTAWPTLRLARTDTTGWTVAFPAGRFAPLAMDSLAGFATADSLRFTRELARIASAAPGDTADAMRGLPYVVHRAWRGTLRSGADLVVAEIDRSLNQEANPQHEHLVLVAERDSATKSWRTGWSERLIGGEDVLASIELLAAGYPRGRDEPVVLIARYLGDGVVYALLAREGTRWRVRWLSPYVGC